MSKEFTLNEFRTILEHEIDDNIVVTPHDAIWLIDQLHDEDGEEYYRKIVEDAAPPAA